MVKFVHQRDIIPTFNRISAVDDTSFPEVESLVDRGRKKGSSQRQNLGPDASRRAARFLIIEMHVTDPENDRAKC